MLLRSQNAWTRSSHISTARQLFQSSGIQTRYIGVKRVQPPGDVRGIPMISRPAKTIKDIPGPKSWPLIGPLHNFLPGGAFYKMNRTKLFNELHKLYGPIVKIDKIANHLTTIFLYDAEAVGKILRREDPTPRRPPMESLDLLRKHTKFVDLINGWGSSWKNFRSPSNKPMMDHRLVSASYADSLVEVAKEAVERFRSILNEDGTMVDIEREFKLWALESTTLITLGRRLNCFDINFPEDSYEKKLITSISTVFNKLERVDFEHNVMKLFNSRIVKDALEGLIQLNSTIDYLINDSLKSIEGKNISKDLENSTLMKIMEKNKDAALAIGYVSMVAGVDTVTHAMLFLLYFLGANVKKQQRLRDEVLSGHHKKSYLRACMKESSRIFPTAFVNSRITTKPHQILGYNIPEGISVVFPHQIMCSMEKYFPRANEFIPERWLVGKDHPLYYGNGHPFAHSPFGFGVRTCIGRRVAELTIESLVTNMVKSFEIKWVGPPPEVIPKTINKFKDPTGFVFKNI